MKITLELPDEDMAVALLENAEYSILQDNTPDQATDHPIYVWIQETKETHDLSWDRELWDK